MTKNTKLLLYTVVCSLIASTVSIMAIAKTKDIDNDVVDTENEEVDLIYKINSSKINLTRGKIASMVTSLSEIWGKCKGEVTVYNRDWNHC